MLGRVAFLGVLGIVGLVMEDHLDSQMLEHELMNLSQ